MKSGKPDLNNGRARFCRQYVSNDRTKSTSVGRATCRYKVLNRWRHQNQLHFYSFEVTVWVHYTVLESSVYVGQEI